MTKKILVALFGVSLALAGCATTKVDPTFTCATNIDCVSSCGMGCINKEWAEDYKDECVNGLAYLCTCVNNECYTNGKPPKPTQN